ncbi:hypothetical protein [Enterobacter hormaechei]|uniref:hypothetical protein n=1 Tax=Enterobacter hormaechei TaxID=158836 RepID=UPI00331453F8
MLMSVNTETASAQGQTTVLEKEGVYASLFEKINLTPASSLGDINAFLDDAALSDAPAGERLREWEPDLLFEVQARRLKLLRMKAGRSESDKIRLMPEMDALLAGLITIDPARAMVLCG